jgi:peptide-methionine (R)-S-oxide reductase
MSERIDKSDQEWRDELTPEQFAVCRAGGTERAFSGEYVDCKEDGTYSCVCCGQTLFRSETKYDSGSGWPSFWQSVDPGVVRLLDDNSHGMRRVEVRCARCDAHLGHLFDDGPRPSGKRFCINSVALRMDPDRDRDGA